MSLQTFDPRNLPKYAVIRAPLPGTPEEKLLVLISHQKNKGIVCLKATSKVALYLNNKEKMAGCVFYRAGQVDCFSRDTAIQVDNPCLVFYEDIESDRQCVGQMPDDFEKKLIKAITASVTIEENRRDKMLEWIRPGP